MRNLKLVAIIMTLSLFLQGCSVYNNIFRPYSTTELDYALDDLVRIDARSWIANRYKPKSMRNVRVIDSSHNGRVLTVKGDYTYNRNRYGWVKVKYVDGNFHCISYHDNSSCRELGNNTTRQFMAAALTFGTIAALSSGSDSGNDYRYDNTPSDNFDFEKAMQHQQYRQCIQEKGVSEC